MIADPFALNDKKTRLFSDARDFWKEGYWGRRGKCNCEFVPFDPYFLDEAVQKLFADGLVAKGMNFLDPTAGVAVPGIIAASYGLNSYNIEINKFISRAARNFAASARDSSLIDEFTKCEIASGSYFTADYIALRKSGKSIAVEYELLTKEPGYWDDDLPMDKKKAASEINKDLGAHVTSPCPYASLGISLGQVDVFFTYTWTIQLPSLLEMFAMYSKKDAVMLNSTAGLTPRFEEMLERLGLEGKLFLSRGELIEKYGSGALFVYSHKI